MNDGNCEEKGTFNLNFYKLSYMYLLVSSHNVRWIIFPNNLLRNIQFPLMPNCHQCAMVVLYSSLAIV